jgi:N-acetylglucosaminyl-diphospho-decaprenol L-rhamnosyltransferase
VPPDSLAVVVVTHHNADHLPTTLKLIREQLRPDDELIVVDNASSDSSADVARAAAPDATVIALDVNHGFGAGCRAAAAASSAPLLLFLNPDARLERGALDALRRPGTQEPSWGAWQALVLLPGGATVNTSGGVLHWLGLAWAGQCDAPVAAVASNAAPVGFASGAAMVVRRAAWDQVGGFEPAYFMYGEDVDLSVRLRLAGWDLRVVPEALVEHEYEFTKGDYKWFHLERNRIWTILAAYPAPLLVLLAPALAGFELALLVIAARDGWLRPKLRAQVAVLRTLPWALRRRRGVQALARADAAAFAAALTASLDSPYLRAPAPLVRMQRAYWRAVLTVLGRAR